MKTDPIAPVAVMAAVTASTYAGVQISSTQGMLTWLVIGACTGACTAICMPANDEDDRKPHALKRKFAFSLFCGIGATFAAFGYFEAWVPTADRLFGFSWAIGTIAWLAVPVAIPLLKAMLKRWSAKQ